MEYKPINIMLVEDHKLIRVGIRTLFEETDGCCVVAEAETGKEAVDKASITNPDIILIDLGLPDMSGLKLIKLLQDKDLKSKIIILSSHNNEDEIVKSLSMGVYAYVLKDINTEMLIYIVKSVFNGAMWLDPKVVPLLRNKSESVVPQKQTSRAMFKNSHANLTQREYEVLKLVVDGKSNNDIAKELCISEHTAKAHVCNIIQKLVVDDRTQAAVKAIKEGIV
ncbi:MAG: response regulator transcription factor [Candidatus Gastranaerophilales bacterium]|nr:response regulator transcription factor [Candidatus Gastranaerophilales bacterium]